MSGVSRRAGDAVNRLPLVSWVKGTAARNRNAREKSGRRAQINTNNWFSTKRTSLFFPPRPGGCGAYPPVFHGFPTRVKGNGPQGHTPAFGRQPPGGGRQRPAPPVHRPWPTGGDPAGRTRIETPRKRSHRPYRRTIARSRQLPWPAEGLRTGVWVTLGRAGMPPAANGWMDGRRFGRPDPARRSPAGRRHTPMRCPLPLSGLTAWHPAPRRVRCGKPRRPPHQLGLAGHQ